MMIRVEEEVEFWEWTLFCRCYRRRRSGSCLFGRLPVVVVVDGCAGGRPRVVSAAARKH
jgi:hypothetical protein